MMNKQSFGEQLAARLIADNLIVPDARTGQSLIGCTEEEIEEVMRKQNVDFLPSSYRDYLRVMGKYPGGLLLMGEGVTYPYLLIVKQQLEGVMIDEGHFQLNRNDHFVFLGNDLCYYYFFYTKDRDDNPPLYAFFVSVGDSPAQVLEIAPSFAVFIDRVTASAKARWKL